METLKRLIREVPDFPKPGILFYDITTLLLDPDGLRQAINCLVEPYRNAQVDKVVGIESRGFILGAAVANHLGVGFVPVRKPGKLPSRSVRKEYALEYGTDALEMHADAVSAGDRILIVDDLLATGGTARAVADMIGESGATVHALAFLIELGALHGRDQLDGHEIFSVLHY